MIRLRDDDEGAAETGILETTTKSNYYKYADNSNISFVDLPGIDTPSPIFQTCEKTGWAGSDMFLIISSTSFTEFELAFSETAKSNGKAIFLIRTKIDIDMKNESRKRNFDENKTLKYVREEVYKTAKHLISSEKEIFLISNYVTNKWDFGRLTSAISEALFVLQREFLTNATRECLKRKVYSHIFAVNFVCCKAKNSLSKPSCPDFFPVANIAYSCNDFWKCHENRV